MEGGIKLHTISLKKGKEENDSIDAPSLSYSCSVFRTAIFKHECKSLGISEGQTKKELSGATVGSCSKQVSLKVKPAMSVCLLRSKTEAELSNTVTLGIFGSPAHLHTMDTGHYTEALVQPKENYTDAYT